jgi:chromate transporter
MKSDDSPATAKAPTPLRLFGVFGRISAVTIGGGYAMVPVMETALRKRGWTTEKEFYDLFAAAQSFPGPLAFTTALVVGGKLGGTAGAVAGGAGVLLPPFAAIVLVGSLIGRYGQVPALRAFLDGAGATVPGLVAAMVYKVAKNRSWNIARIIGVIALAVALILLPAASLPVFLAGAGLFYLGERRWRS